MIRFFVAPAQIHKESVVLGPEDAHHLRVVLKASPGYRLAVLDGAGTEIMAEVTALSKTEALGRILSRRTLHTEARARITVAQALPKMSDKLEQVLQRGTEIGVTSFWCYASARSVGHLEGERNAKRLQRAAAIVKTAAEQSHRAVLPTLRIDNALGDVIATAGTFDIALLAYEGQDSTTLRAILDPAAERTAAISRPTVLVVVGPEGGFSDEEVLDAAAGGLAIAGLGSRILRTETAALVAVSQILYALEPVT